MTIRIPGSEDGMGRIWAIAHIWLQKRLGLTDSEVDEHLSRHPSAPSELEKKILFGMEIPHSIPIIVIMTILIAYFFWDALPNWQTIAASPSYMVALVLIVFFLIWDRLPQRKPTSAIAEAVTLDPQVGSTPRFVSKMGNWRLNTSYDEMDGFQLTHFILGFVATSMTTTYFLAICWMEPTAIHISLLAGSAEPVFLLMAMICMADVSFSFQKSTDRPRAFRFALLDLTITLWRMLALLTGYLTISAGLTRDVLSSIIVISAVSLLDLAFNHIVPVLYGDWYMPKSTMTK